MERFLDNSPAVLTANAGATMAEVPILLDPKNDGPRRLLLRQVRNPDVLRFWREFEHDAEREQREFVESTSSTIDAFLAQAVVAKGDAESDRTVATATRVQSDPAGDRGVPSGELVLAAAPARGGAIPARLLLYPDRRGIGRRVG